MSNTYKNRKSMGLCVRCGKNSPKSLVYCDNCLKIHNQECRRLDIIRKERKYKLAL